MQIITGRTGEPHIYASDDAELYKLFLGDGDFCLMTGNRLALNRISPTVVNISDGSLIMQGRLAKIRPTDGYDTLTLDNGTQGDKRMDLVVAEYNQQIIEKQVEQGGQIVTVEDKIESVELKIVKGTPNKSRYVEPSITTGDIDLGETHQMVLYAVKLDGIDSGGIEDRRVFLDTTPIQSAISYARGSINTIRAELDELGADVYQYADSLREGISQGFKGCWKAASHVTIPNTRQTGVAFRNDRYSRYRFNINNALTSGQPFRFTIPNPGAEFDFVYGEPSEKEDETYLVRYLGNRSFIIEAKNTYTVLDWLVEGISAIRVTMPDTYSYSDSDSIDIYFNGLRLAVDEYTVTGNANEIQITPSLDYANFNGIVEVVATRITTE